MNRTHVEKIADAVLYEGYILYPYRPSSVKNRQRFNFGALCPEPYSRAQKGTDAWSMQTECLIQGDERAAIEVKLRFLHLLAREVCRQTATQSELPQAGVSAQLQGAESLEPIGQASATWQEAVERDVCAPRFYLAELIDEPQRATFVFPSKEESEALSDGSGEVVTTIVRSQQAIEGAIELRAERSGDQLFKITVRVMNLTPFENADVKSRDEALMRALVSTHTILRVLDGEFVSLLDPPEAFGEAVASCSNVGTWPVLVGEDGARDCMLSSPIILYDYPQIAPESAGDLFDSTEIDEILTLRIMTLTDEEKLEMRNVDERARRMLERVETLPPEQLMKMHGVMRSLRSAGEKKQ